MGHGLCMSSRQWGDYGDLVLQPPAQHCRTWLRWKCKHSLESTAPSRIRLTKSIWTMPLEMRYRPITGNTFHDSICLLLFLVGNRCWVFIVRLQRVCSGSRLGASCAESIVSKKLGESSETCYTSSRNSRIPHEIHDLH